MTEMFKLGLQFFGGEGGGAGAGASGGTSGASAGGEGQAASGDNATAAAEQRLRELGVPEGKIRKRTTSTVAAKLSAIANKAEQTEAKATEVATVATNEDTPTESKKDDAPRRMTWAEIMRDPEYNKEMQKTVSSRLKAEKPAKEALEAMRPAIEVMARKYGLDAKNMDYQALAKAINDDDAYYEDKAIEMGTSVETAKRVDQMEREAERRKAQEQMDIEAQKMRQHFISLEEQGQKLKGTFPGFDLRAELGNPKFARLVSPGVGLTVEDAYYAVHREEIQAASMQVAAQRTAEKISNSIQSNSKRPDELGASSQAPSVSTFDYRSASKSQREALKKQIRDAAARGEKLYPGQR